MVALGSREGGFLRCPALQEESLSFWKVGIPDHGAAEGEIGDRLYGHSKTDLCSCSGGNRPNTPLLPAKRKKPNLNKLGFE